MNSGKILECCPSAREKPEEKRKCEGEKEDGQLRKEGEEEKGRENEGDCLFENKRVCLITGAIRGLIFMVR